MKVAYSKLSSRNEQSSPSHGQQHPFFKEQHSEVFANSEVEGKVYSFRLVFKSSLCIYITLLVQMSFVLERVYKDSYRHYYIRRPFREICFLSSTKPKTKFGFLIMCEIVIFLKLFFISYTVHNIKTYCKKLWWLNVLISNEYNDGFRRSSSNVGYYINVQYTETAASLILLMKWGLRRASKVPRLESSCCTSLPFCFIP